MTEKVCSKCGESKPAAGFKKGRNTCRTCQGTYEKARSAAKAACRAEEGYIVPVSKICKSCGKELPVEQFKKNKKVPSGYNNTCKTCTNVYEKTRCALHAERRAKSNYVAPPKKVCILCGENKESSEFYPDRRNTTGVASVCKTCTSTRNAAKRQSNILDRLNDNKFSVPAAKKCTKCGEEKPSRDFYSNLSAPTGLTSLCKSCSRVYNKQWFSSLSGDKKIKQKDNHRVASKRYYDTQCKKDKKTGLGKRGRVDNFLRATLRRVLTLTDQKKLDNTSHILGYTKEKLRDRLEMNFKQGMSWQNASEWHIDHVIPVSHFLNKGETRPHIINALCNLRPLWAAENLAKKDKLPEFLARKY